MRLGCPASSARLLLIFALFAATALPAQVVRGRISEVNTAAPVVGALVSLLAEVSDSSIVSVLTGSAGEYAIRAAAPGRYRVSVKRIGVRRQVSVAFDLREGETRVFDVSIDPIAQTLPQVTVSGLCVTRPGELARISSLWDEARTAFEATEVSLRDHLMVTRISRYAAELDPANLRVRFDWRSDAQVMTQQPFTSPSGDSLSALGYWRQLPDDSVEFLAPDASALASNAFLRDHCFALAGVARGRPDLVGLNFVPARDRTLPDISGTIWLDARRFELRFVEFRYTLLPQMPNVNRVGGEVHFARLLSGAWIVDRWFIRMPQVVVVPDALEPRRQLYEVGGAVVTDGVASSVRSASVTGVLRDSGGRPVPGAVVRAIGTQRQVVTDTTGAFTLDSLPPGGLSVVAHTDGYDSFAVLAASRRVVLQAGRALRLDLRTPDAGGIRSEACPDPNLRYIQRARGRGALRLVMVDSATSVPMPSVRFIAAWPPRGDPGAGTLGADRQAQAVTDARGAATFCDLPFGFPIQVALVGPDGSRMNVMTLELSRAGITGRVVIGKLHR